MDKEKKSSTEDDTDSKNVQQEKPRNVGKMKKKLRRYVEEGIALTESESDTPEESASTKKKKGAQPSSKSGKHHQKKRRYIDDDLESGVTTVHHRDNCKIFLAVFSVLVTLLCVVLIADLHYQRRSDVHTDIERATRLIQHIEKDHMGITAEQLYRRQAKRQMDELEKNEDAAEAASKQQSVKPKDVSVNTTITH